MFNIILIGPQGSGKGTQAQLLAKKFGFKTLGTGAIFREAAEQQNKRGQLIHDLINEKGKLLPDGIVLELVEEYLEDHDWGSGIIYDGFPRTVKQFNLLEDYLVDRDQYLHLGVFLDINDEIAIDRLSNRVKCTLDNKIYNLKYNPPPPECQKHLISRDDDKPEAIKTRLELFRAHTKPIIDLMDEKGILEKIDGSGTPEDIFEKITTIIKRKGFQQ